MYIILRPIVYDAYPYTIHTSIKTYTNITHIHSTHTHYVPIVNQRNDNLRLALSQLNALLYNRMLSKGQYGLQQLSNHLTSLGSQGLYTPPYTPSSNPHTTHSPYTTPHMSPATLQSNNPPQYNTHQNLPQINANILQQIAQSLPDISDYSIHIPLQHCDDKVLRILRFVEHECEVLPSKDRCPYLLICEVIERPYICKSDRLYAQPTVASLTNGIQDRQQHRIEQGYTHTQSHPSYTDITSNPSSISIPDPEPVIVSRDRTILPSSNGIVPPSFVDIAPPPPPVDPEVATRVRDEAKSNIHTFARDDIQLPHSSHSFSSSTSTSSTSVESLTASIHELEILDAMSHKLGVSADTVVESPFELPPLSPATISSTIHSLSFEGGSDELLDCSMRKRDEQQHQSSEFSVELGDNNVNNTAATDTSHTSSLLSSPTSVEQHLSVDTHAQASSPTIPQPSISGSKKGTSVFDRLKRRPPPSSSSTHPDGRDIRGGAIALTLSLEEREEEEGVQETEALLGTEEDDWENVSVLLSSTTTASYEASTTATTIPTGPSAESISASIYDQPPSPASSPYPQSSTSQHPLATYPSYTFSPSLPHSSPSKMTFLRGKTAEERRELVRNMSAFGHIPGWGLKAFIVKSGDDLRKEILAMQLIEYCQQVWYT